jgi:hypothetical protein
VVHGRNGAARGAVFAFLRSIGLTPIEWHDALVATGKASPYDLSGTDWHTSGDFSPPPQPKAVLQRAAQGHEGTR